MEHRHLAENEKAQVTKTAEKDEKVILNQTERVGQDNRMKEVQVSHTIKVKRRNAL